MYTTRCKFYSSGKILAVVISYYCVKVEVVVSLVAECTGDDGLWESSGLLVQLWVDWL